MFFCLILFLLFITNSDYFCFVIVTITIVITVYNDYFAKHLKQKVCWKTGGVFFAWVRCWFTEVLKVLVTIVLLKGFCGKMRMWRVKKLKAQAC